MASEVWTKVTIQFVGGLVQIGFAENSDLLLVLSHNGRGIFDCLTGEKIARDTNDFFNFFDENTLIAKGFDVLESEKIKTAGLYGGNLSTKTYDGWELSIHESNNQTEKIYLSSENENQRLVDDNEIVNVRAFGFSETGKSFVVATTSDLTIFSRQL